MTLELARLAGVASPRRASLKQWQRRILNQTRLAANPFLPISNCDQSGIYLGIYFKQQEELETYLTVFLNLLFYTLFVFLDLKGFF